MRNHVFITAVLIFLSGFQPFSIFATSEEGRTLDYSFTPQFSLRGSNLEKFAISEESLIIAYYGRPKAAYMGIVGRHSKEEIIERVKTTANDFQTIASHKKAKPALYLIYGTCQPQGEIGYMSDAMTHEYIRYALEEDTLIILDHQIGRYTLKEAVDRLLPYLVYPNVHIALDFEWRTVNPMKEIGYVRGEELNWVQEYVQDFLSRNRIPVKKYIVFHQFTKSMLRDPYVISSVYPQVGLIHCTSGWGPPDKKASTHALNAAITQVPLKGFKLWYHYSDKPGIHFDDPLMTPNEVLSLSPAPLLVIYQ